MSTPLVSSHFVAPLISAEAMFEARHVQVTHQGKNIKVETPQQWSDLATQMAFDKYMRKNDVPRIKNETSVFQLVNRVVQTIAEAGEKQKYFSRQQRCIFENELKFILLSQRACFNSPVWFNVGLHARYGITADHTNYSWDPAKQKLRTNHNSYARPQASACFIQSIHDDMDSIYNLIKSEAMLFKYGSGSGTNFSPLRSKHSVISTGETSSGLISFLEIFDKSAGVVKSGGTTRRAAKMVCLDVTHPEISEFILWKMKEEKKAAVLLRNGFSGGLNGEATRSVSGQNSNNSVRVTNAFMRAVQENKPWILKDSKAGFQKTVQAKELWEQICQAAWTCADPGLQFHDQINAWNTCQQQTIHASNPCSEFMFLDDTACNLASINLQHYLDAKNKFCLQDFLHTVHVLILAQDILVGLAGYPTAQIAKNSAEYRPLGLGITNLATFFLQQALPYDSDEARHWGSFICALLSGAAYQQSAALAKQRGAFRQFSSNKKSVLQVLKKHRQQLKLVKSSSLDPALIKAVQQIWNEVVAQAEKTGVRNAQISALAPTGTISFIMDCETTGIEPEFSWSKIKTTVDDQQISLSNKTVLKTLKLLGYSEAELEKITVHLRRQGTFHQCPGLKSEHALIFQTAVDPHPDFCLSQGSHLKMMAACQPFISGAISKTVNLPQSTTVEEISSVYFLAWKLGLKSVAVYRDQSKIFQPLNNTTEELSCMECA